MRRASKHDQSGEAKTLSAAEADQVFSRGEARVHDPHTLLKGKSCFALTDSQCCCAQMWHEEQLGDCFWAVVNQIAMGCNIRGGLHGAADPPFITLLRGISPATAAPSGPQVSPPQRSLKCLR